MNRRIAVLATTIVFALAAVSVAAAHGGPGGRGPGGPGGPAFGGSVSSLVTKAASQLNVARSKLVSAIQDSAKSHIASAKTDGDITSDQADDLTADAEDNLTAAYAISETKTVASNLAITTSALNTAFQAARKALALAQIQSAQAAERITSDEAATLTTRVNGTTFPGYKGGVGLGPGFGFGH
jgi:hypothetical protein